MALQGVPPSHMGALHKLQPPQQEHPPMVHLLGLACKALLQGKPSHSTVPCFVDKEVLLCLRYRASECACTTKFKVPFRGAREQAHRETVVYMNHALIQLYCWICHSCTIQNVAVEAVCDSKLESRKVHVWYMSDKISCIWTCNLLHAEPRIHRLWRRPYSTCLWCR